MGPQRALGEARRQLDALVAGTPPQRDRYVDLLRVVAIGVVVVWHWCLSILHWHDGRFVMPNPIHTVPGGWLATWLLQIVPVFFIVGGYANSAAWWAAKRDGLGVAGYLTVRLRRLLVPVAVFAAVWLVIEVVAQLAVPGYPGVLRYGLIVFTPLWFIAAYGWVVMLTPLTVTAHDRGRWLALGVLVAAVLAADLGRFGYGMALLGWVNTALVWVLVHQLGYFWRDGTLARLGAGGSVGVAAGGVLALAVLTSLDQYPPSMVTTVGQPRSNMLPTTAAIAAVAVLQLGVISLLRTPVTRWLHRPRAWRPVVATNAVIMTIFAWHMTALVVVLAVLRATGVQLEAEPTGIWWAQRPFWLVLPALVLAVLVAIFGRFELAGRALPR